VATFQAQHEGIASPDVGQSRVTSAPPSTVTVLPVMAVMV
jgi:hypothetical protein